MGTDSQARGGRDGCSRATINSKLKQWWR
jgi:hypothetical protein